jgi:hypothetical protein
VNIIATLEGTDQLRFNPPANWDSQARTDVATALTATLSTVQSGYVVTQPDPEVVITQRPTDLLTWNATKQAVRDALCRLHPAADVIAWAATLV